MKIKNNYKLHCITNRSIKFIDYCNNNGIELFNLNKINDGIEFELSESGYRRFIKLKNLDYDVKVVDLGGTSSFFNKFRYRIGLVIGMIICLIAVFLLNNRILQIHIYGLTNIEKQVVVDELNSYGIGVLDNIQFDTTILEDKLSNKFNFALCSIITKGNSVIINVKESLPEIEDTYAPITSDYNMIIESITVYSGTSKVRAGEIVHKGDVIVEPYIEKNGNIVYVTPCADIVGKVFCSESYYFRTRELKYVSTGNKKLLNFKLIIGNKFELFNINKECDFKNFEIENISHRITDYYVPIYMNKIYMCELEEVEIIRDFNEEKDSIVDELKNKIKNNIPIGSSADSEQVEIVQVGEDYIVNVYIATIVNLKYQFYDIEKNQT